MKLIKMIFGLIISFLFLQSTAIATSEYGKIDVYFNDKILPGSEVATPTIKIGEPFKIKINITVYNEYKVSGQLSEIEGGNFLVINGPSEMNKYSTVILKPNESHIFEWTVKPTELWAGGSLPINFRYSLVEKGNPEPVVNSGFTVAYCTISNEYYEEKNLESEKQEVTELETPAEIKSPPASVSTPAFTFIGSIFTAALVFALARKKL